MFLNANNDGTWMASETFRTRYADGPYSATKEVTEEVSSHKHLLKCPCVPGLCGKCVLCVYVCVLSSVISLSNVIIPSIFRQNIAALLSCEEIGEPTGSMCSL